MWAWNAGAELGRQHRTSASAGNFSRAVRRRVSSTCILRLGQNFAPTSGPLRQLGKSPPVQRCGQPTARAAGVPAGFDFVYHPVPGFLSGGNPNLKEETSDSFTVGVVLQPRFLPGFSFSADYYDIAIDDVITAPAAQQILDACYDAADLNNQFCGVFQRVLGPEVAPGAK